MRDACEHRVSTPAGKSWVWTGRRSAAPTTERRVRQHCTWSAPGRVKTDSPSGRSRPTRSPMKSRPFPTC
jgi:hypothetical protein